MAEVLSARHSDEVPPQEYPAASDAISGGNAPKLLLADDRIGFSDNCGVLYSIMGIVIIDKNESMLSEPHPQLLFQAAQERI
jgi:hypothetical protein